MEPEDQIPPQGGPLTRGRARSRGTPIKTESLDHISLGKEQSAQLQSQMISKQGGKKFGTRHGHVKLKFLSPSPPRDEFEFRSQVIDRLDRLMEKVAHLQKTIDEVKEELRKDRDPRALNEIASDLNEAAESNLSEDDGGYLGETKAKRHDYHTFLQQIVPTLSEEHLAQWEEAQEIAGEPKSLAYFLFMRNDLSRKVKESY